MNESTTNTNSRSADVERYAPEFLKNAWSACDAASASGNSVVSKISLHPFETKGCKDYPQWGLPMMAAFLRLSANRMFIFILRASNPAVAVWSAIMLTDWLAHG